MRKFCGERILITMPRLTFPHVALQKHPLNDGSFVGSVLALPPNKPDEVDAAIAKEIISVHERLKKVLTADGEWLWINKNKKPEYIRVLQEGDAQGLARILANVFRDPAIYGVITSDFSTTGSPEGKLALENAILLDLDAWREFTEQDDADLPMLDMPRVGNPYGALINDVLISADHPRHDYYALKLAELARVAASKRPVVLEVGGGYGGLCLQFHRRVTGGVFINCDLPESLYLAYYFLRRGTDKKIVWAIDAMPSFDEGADIILVPAQRREIIAGPVDIVFNANSFSEMERKTMEEYMRLLHRLLPTYFLHQNSNFLLFPNSPRHIEVLASTFPIDKKVFREVYRAIMPWQGAGGRYREFLYQRI